MSSNVGPIIIPVDFGEQSLLAARQSYNLARLTKSDITLLHVIDDDFLKSLKSFVGGKDDYEDEFKVDIRKKLNNLAANIHNESGIKVDSLIKTGKIYEEILDAASEINASLILMGTMGPIGLKKKILGSNASRVVRMAECPVMTIKGKDHRFGIKHILLPLDLTTETKEKVDKAIELADMFSSVIHVVTVIESDDEFIQNKLTRQMNQVQDFILKAGIDCTSEFIESDDVTESILEAAEKTESDLIMIMTQPEMIIKEYFISSSAQEIINNSTIPVLSIRPTLKKDTTVFVTQ